MNIGENIKKYRLQKKISRKDLSEKIGVSESTISRYENNKREPNIETIKNIAFALSISYSDLMSDDIHAFERNLVMCLKEVYINKYNKNFSDEEIINDILSQLKYNKDHLYNAFIGLEYFHTNEIESLLDYIKSMDEVTFNSFFSGKYNIENIKALGSHIKNQRISKKISIDDLANKCDVDINYIQRLEQGFVEFPKRNLLFKIFDILELDIDQILPNYRKGMEMDLNDYEYIFNDIDNINDFITIVFTTSSYMRKRMSNITTVEVEEKFYADVAEYIDLYLGLIDKKASLSNELNNTNNNLNNL